MPFENWDIVHYVIVSDVIVSHQFVIQSHPSLQSASCIGKAIGEHVWRQENLHLKFLLSSWIIYLLNRSCMFFPKPEICSNFRGEFTEVSKLPRGAPAKAGWRETHLSQLSSFLDVCVMWNSPPKYHILD